MKKREFILLISALVLFLSSSPVFAKDVDILQCQKRPTTNDPVLDLEACEANCTNPDFFCHQEPDGAGKTATYCCPPEAESSSLGKITLPSWLQWTRAHPGVSGINLLINNLIKLIFILASVGLFLMFLWGGVNYIFSQGDKARTESARNIITYALIGFAIVALSFALMRLIETFFGISIIGWPPTCPFDLCVDWSGKTEAECTTKGCVHRTERGFPVCCPP